MAKNNRTVMYLVVTNEPLHTTFFHQLLLLNPDQLPEGILYLDNMDDRKIKVTISSGKARKKATKQLATWSKNPAVKEIIPVEIN